MTVLMFRSLVVGGERSPVGVDVLNESMAHP
jgi:hypothetical protein